MNNRNPVIRSEKGFNEEYLHQSLDDRITRLKTHSREAHSRLCNGGASCPILRGKLGPLDFEEVRGNADLASLYSSSSCDARDGTNEVVVMGPMRWSKPLVYVVENDGMHRIS